MRKYEILYILQADLEESVIKELIEKVNGLVTQNGGEIESVKEWGKRRLQFEINDMREGYYVEVNFAGTPEVIKELDRVIKITDGFMRHMIVRKDD